jgi:3-mercaptopyruvate sulfurtransferase SseA
MTKTEGIYGCTVISGKAGEIDGVPNVQISVQIADGPDKGQRCTYEDVVNNGSAKYVAWSCKAVGWKGVNLETLESDINAWIASTGGASTVEIKHLEIKKGKNAGKIWDKVAGIGRGAARPLSPLSKSALADANEAMRAAARYDGPPVDDVPHAAGYDGFGD